ncbi:NAD(P)/FAD-dependent oxidoreductase [Aureimonas pseudogalii]|uniref:Sarcosine oxidase n=1 Tax=Aureimonas pseudogalii TaxID=1744844 RepID=A0A7W6H6B3_9HYPH|nr:FAD-binding oxidoreductase [Aureimonas pseudogalii]MBB3999364.1 sarcosine oxidase [Aureimonas pseudogalii]
MLNDPRSHGLWERTAPPAPQTQALEGDRVASVVVVGAGFTGCSAALHLAEAGVDVALIEGAEIGFGGSGRNVGLVNAGLWILPDDVPAALGEVHGERLLTLLGDAPHLVFELVERHAIACEPVRSGTLHCAVGETGVEEIAERARQWQRRGADVELLDADDARRRIGSPAYRGALLDRRAGTIQPLAYVRGLASAAQKAGAAIFTGSPVGAVSKAGARWRVETPRGSVTADWIVVATNAYTKAPWPEIREEIVHLPYFNIATRPLSSNLAATILPERQGCWDTKDVLSSFRFDKAGRLVIGSVGALRGGGAAIHRRWARASLARLFPQLGEIAFEAEWYGQIGMTADSAPRFHRLAERVISFSGYNGRGIAPGTAFGRLAAEYVLGRLAEDDLPLPVTAAVPQRFRAARAAGYEVGAALAHLSSRI